MNDGRPNLRLITRPEPAGGSESASKASHPASGPRRPLLYVSGDKEGRIVFTRVARRWETIKLLVADSAEEGLDMAITRRPRMVVLDAMLTDLDGEKLVTALRERAMPPSKPIIVLAHDGAPSERARFIWAGASAYLAKPLNVAEIDKTVGMLLDVAALR